MTEFEIRLREVGDGTASVEWVGRADPALLLDEIAVAARNAFRRGDVRRLEVVVPADDVPARRSVLRAGFRLEGVRRAAQPRPGGEYVDLMLFARLFSDEVGGRHGFSGVMNSVLPRKRVIAHVLVRDPDGRVLLCETVFKPDWELPGGIVEELEPPRVGAVREVLEELGVELAVGRLLVADWMPPYLGWDDALELIFDGGLWTEQDLDRLDLQPTEIRSVRFVDLDEAAHLVTPLSHRRLSVALGLTPGTTAYLEDGRVAADLG